MMDIVVYIDVYIVNILIPSDAESYSASDLCLTKKDTKIQTSGGY